MSEGDNRRRWGRTRPADKTSVFVLVGHRQLHGNVVDISHSGVLISMSDPPAVGENVIIDFAVHDRGVRAKARVVRVAQDNEPAGVAVVLAGVPLEDRMSLDTLIERAAKASRDE